MEQHLIHIEVLDTATSQGRKQNKTKTTQIEKDGELEKEERSKGKKSRMKRKGTKNRNLLLFRFPRVRWKMDAILGHCEGGGRGDASLWSSGSLRGNMGW